MKTIFSELYNRLLELFQIEKSENTGECAANRLQVILMHDRTKLDPLIMGKMRCELIEVFSKYVVIDKEKLEIDLKNEGDAAALMLNIPIVRAKTEEELEELRKELQNAGENEARKEDNKADDNGAENKEETPEAVKGNENGSEENSKAVKEETLDASDAEQEALEKPQEVQTNENNSAAANGYSGSAVSDTGV